MQTKINRSSIRIALCMGFIVFVGARPSFAHLVLGLNDVSLPARGTLPATITSLGDCISTVVGGIQGRVVQGRAGALQEQCSLEVYNVEDTKGLVKESRDQIENEINALRNDVLGSIKQLSPEVTNQIKNSVKEDIKNEVLKELQLRRLTSGPGGSAAESGLSRVALWLLGSAIFVVGLLVGGGATRKFGPR